MSDSILILQKQLEAAQAEIATLERLVHYTVCIIIACGGRVVVAPELWEQADQMEWRREADASGQVFTAWVKP